MEYLIYIHKIIIFVCSLFVQVIPVFSLERLRNMAEKRKDHSTGGSDVELNTKRRRVVDALEIEEEAFLEQEMVKKYRSGGEGLRTFSGNYRTGDFTMFAYRMYLLNHRRSDTLGNTVSLRSRTITKPRVRAQPLQTVDIDRCWGRLDFGFECDKSVND